MQFGDRRHEEESNDPSLFHRTVSSNSFPQDKSSTSDDPVDQLGLYERTLYMLSNDPLYQKEVFFIKLQKTLYFFIAGISCLWEC